MSGREDATNPADRTFDRRRNNREGTVERIKILDEALWRQVPQDVIHEAEQAAKQATVWIARQGNGHIVAMDGPGDPEIATGDLMFIAEVAPSSD
jgi:hypothetical protein